MGFERFYPAEKLEIDRFSTSFPMREAQEHSNERAPEIGLNGFPDCLLSSSIVASTMIYDSIRLRKVINYICYA